MLTLWRWRCWRSRTAIMMIAAAVEVIECVIYSAAQAKAKAEERELIQKLKKKKNLKGLMKVR
jgi:hypothetical protein